MRGVLNSLFSDAARLKRMFYGRRISFYEDMAEALADQESIKDYIEKQITRRKHVDPKMSRLMAHWKRNLDFVSPVLSDAMRDTVPSTDLMVLRAAETSGDMAAGMRYLAVVVDKMAKMRSAVLGAIAGPAFVMVLLIGILIGYSYGMVPLLSSVIPPEKWNILGKILFHVSKFVTGYGVLLLIAIVAIIGLFNWSLANWSSPLRRKMDNYFPYSVYRDYNASIFLALLSMMMNSHLSVADSINLMRASSSPWMRWYLSKILENITNHGKEADSINVGILPRELAYRVSDLGERQSFSDSINKVGMDAMEKMTKKMGVMAGIMNKMGILVVGLCLGIIIAGTMLTAMEAHNAIHSSVSARR